MSKILTERVNKRALIALIFHQVEFAPPVGYVEPERQERSEEKKEEEVQYLLEEKALQTIAIFLNTLSAVLG